MEPKTPNKEGALTMPVTSPDVKVSLSKIPKGKKGRAKVLYFWCSTDVNKWLKKHCRPYHQLYGDLFVEHDISGRALIRLNDYKLQEIGIEDSNHREDILRNILQLKLKTEYQELKALDQRIGVTFERK
ncbi:hypothetical protein LSH36_13g20010 [Paralvinella palmiformis]|uniref:SAM domain-containing protein n=1 Tax=Paralvinella palmiformis TaxID=53620 RepID=A0AAD9KD15_9ANNE|nr:hypothetical protein LSH36_13g20010 [Paralvinella palmiformis]